MRDTGRNLSNGLLRSVSGARRDQGRIWVCGEDLLETTLITGGTWIALLVVWKVKSVNRLTMNMQKNKGQV